MPFQFSIVCELFQRLEEAQTADRILLRSEKGAVARDETRKWFKSHASLIEKLHARSAIALLSAFLPEWRTDRCYDLQQDRLCNILCRAMRLGGTRQRSLREYRQSGGADLGACVERVLLENGDQAWPPITLEEVDDYFQLQAGRSRFSAKTIPRSSEDQRENLLAGLMSRARPLEGKWLVRLLLKNLAPVEICEAQILSLYHFMLPDLVKFQRNLGIAVTLLKEELAETPPHPDLRSEVIWRREAARLLSPKVGVKVGRPAFWKCRSIDHCTKMVGTESYVLERKYDGEYCEIHIDQSLSSKPAECIKIFSKSGKESTVGRSGIHQTLINCLRLGQPDCKIKRRAIILGELVVWSDAEDCVLPFEKIRKHVTRWENAHDSARSGCDLDSQPHSHEHLAIVFFDLLLLDDEVVMRRPVEERRQWLREVYQKRHGRAWSTEWKIVDFADPIKGRQKLVEHFAASVAQRCEGLVLKPCGVPYFALGPETSSHPAYIKLKKDYIDGLADEADFAVIGASYNAQLALSCAPQKPRWTSLHLGCLTNKADVARFDSRPKFRHVYTVSCRECIPPQVLRAANTLGTFKQPHHQDGTSAPFDVQKDAIVQMDVVFGEPFVFEMIGSGFAKPSNQDFLMLRHARVKKLHEDRDWKDCISFQDLQEQAEAARDLPPDSESQETRRYIELLTKKHQAKFDERRMSRTPSATAADSHDPVPPEDVVPRVLLGGQQNSKMIIAGLPTPLPSSLPHEVQAAPYKSILTDVTPPKKRKRDRCDENGYPEHPSKGMGLASTVDAAIAIDASPIALSSPLSERVNLSQARQMVRLQEPKIDSPCLAVSLRKFLPGRCGDIAIDINGDSITACQSSRCPFANAVVFLSPCIANQLYVSQDLLPTHNAVLATDLVHWDRDSFAYAPGVGAVSESQAFRGLRKIVLVEIRRRAAVTELIRQIIALNHGLFRERVEVYDWRVLEHCERHDRTADLLKQHFVGASIFDDTQKQALFVSSYAWLSVT